MRRGEIFWAGLAPRSGSEQSGRRPVIIVSHDGFNQAPAWRSVIVIPISTSDAQARRGPTAVLLGQGAGGLSRPGVAVCHQVTTLDRAKLGDRLGILPPHVMASVDAGLRIALALGEAPAT